MRSFRGAHAWLRGYSDALAGRGPDTLVWPDYGDDYNRGWAIGNLRSVMP